MRITRKAVLAEAGTVSTFAGDQIVRAVNAATVGQIRQLAEEARADGLSSPGAVAHEVAVQLAMAAGIDW